MEMNTASVVDKISRLKAKSRDFFSTRSDSGNMVLAMVATLQAPVRAFCIGSLEKRHTKEPAPGWRCFPFGGSG